MGFTHFSEIVSRNMAAYRERYEKIMNAKQSVRITGTELNWAEGQIGIIKSLHIADVDKNPSEDPGYLYAVVELDSMDKTVPPFGLVTVKVNQLEILDTEPEVKDDPVNHPSHYTDGKFQVIDFIESKKEVHDSFCLGNAIKYLSRAGKKDPSKKKEDIDKAVWYLQRHLSYMEKTKMFAQSIPDIKVNEYLEDKGLDGTPQGIAIDLICNNQIGTAIKVLQIKDI